MKDGNKLYNLIKVNNTSSYYNYQSGTAPHKCTNLATLIRTKVASVLIYQITSVHKQHGATLERTLQNSSVLTYKYYAKTLSYLIAHIKQDEDRKHL